MTLNRLRMLLLNYMSMLENNPASVFFVLDFDRTIGNTNKSHDVLEGVIERYTSITRQELQEARSQIEQTGASFDTVDYIKTMLIQAASPVTWLEIEEKFITEAHSQDMLEPHAAELLEILNKKKIPYGIITYGNEAWQLAKLQAARLFEVPHLVTHILEKGQLLAGWKHGHETFIIPPALTLDFHPLEVNSIIFLDDKAKSFANLPSGVKGVHIRSVSGQVLPSQQGTLPPDVASVAGLAGVIELLFS